MKINLIFLICCLIHLNVLSQDTLLPVVILDDIIISEEKNGFSVEDFIYYVKNDTTFYKGFKHLRYFQHNYYSPDLVFCRSSGQESGWSSHR